MYKVTVDNAIYFVNDIRYIRLNPKSGSYIQCSEQDAEGVAVNGNLYNLPGKIPIQTITYEKLDEDNFRQVTKDAPVAIIEPYTTEQYIPNLVQANKDIGAQTGNLQSAILEMYENTI